MDYLPRTPYTSMRKGTLGEKVEMKMAKAEVMAPAMQTILCTQIF